MKRLFIYLLPLIILATSACKKNEKENEEEAAVVATIVISNPHEGDTLQGNFAVMSSITATGEMHGYHVRVTNDSDNSVVFEKEVHDHIAAFEINEAITHSFTSYTHLTLKIEVAIDHEGNTNEKEVHFVVKQ